MGPPANKSTYIPSTWALKRVSGIIHAILGDYFHQWLSHVQHVPTMMVARLNCWTLRFEMFEYMIWRCGCKMIHLNNRHLSTKFGPSPHRRHLLSLPCRTMHWTIIGLLHAIDEKGLIWWVMNRIPDVGLIPPFPTELWNWMRRASPPIIVAIPLCMACLSVICSHVYHQLIDLILSRDKSPHKNQCSHQKAGMPIADFAETVCNHADVRPYSCYTRFSITW